jgi:superfamily II DNA or RNA helicase
MNWKLHDDQKAWCRQTVDAFEKGQHGEGPWQRLLSTAATGAGKTVMAAAIAGYALKRWASPDGQPGRVLFLADTDELVQQAVDKFWDAAGLVCDKEKASDRASLASRTVVGSIQTLARDNRLQRFPAGHFALVIADEAHLSMAATWQRVLGHFDAGGARSLGITATPERHDGKDLFKWWQHKPAEIGLFDLIAKGRLAPITVRTVPLELDCTGVHRAGAELDEEELTSAIEPAFDAILDAWEREGEGRKTLWFLPGIAASKEFAQRLLARGHPALHVDGTSTDRRETLARFDTGEAQHLCNAQLLTKGYDQPDIGCVVILRATQSRVAYQQMVGRGTRTAPGKTDLLLLDFLWKFDELGICRPGDLVARTK